ncbi:MAG TPA: ABC transporter permease [Fimbriiglobus sp.]|jgi:ABC-type polysaccharide/polyol phosphate export permease
MIRHVASIWSFRHFWMSLVRLDLRNRYRRSVLGIGWSLLHPLAMTVVFCLVFSKVLNQADWRNYAPFLLAGMAVWEFIRNSTTAGCSAFLQSEVYIRQCPLPYSIYPLRTVIGMGIHFLISLAVVVAMAGVLARGWNVFPAVLMVLPGVVCCALFSWGVATIGAFVTVFFHDIKHLIEVGAQVFFFLTPIMYNRKLLDDKHMGWVADVNPVNLYLELIRTPLLTGQWPTWNLLAVGVVLALITLALAAGAGAWLQKKVIFHL